MDEIQNENQPLNLPVVGNALMYLVALVVGTVISAVLLGVLKKKVA